MIVYYPAYFDYLSRDAKRVANILSIVHSKGKIAVEVIRVDNVDSDVFCEAEVKDDFVILKINIAAIEDGMTYKYLIFKISESLNNAIAKALDLRIRKKETKDEALSRIQNNNWYNTDKSYCEPLSYPDLFWYIFGE